MINKQTFEVLDELAAIEAGIGSREKKLHILKSHKNILREIMQFAFNPYKVFGIKKLPKPTGSNSSPDYDGLTELFNELSDGKGGANNQTKQWVANTFHSFTHDTDNGEKWLKDILYKNIKIGVDIKTLNKAGYNIPTFDCLLADPNPTNSLEGTVFPAYCQAKLDGCRVIRMPDGTFYGRNGKPVPNIQVRDHIQSETTLVLDGEFYSHKRKFNEIVGIFSKDDAPIPDDIKFYVFNAVSKESWDNQKCIVPYYAQLDLIDVIASEGTNIESIVNLTYEVNSEEEIYDLFKMLMQSGFEGAMVRNKNSHYSWDRVKVKDGILTKIKPSDDVDCRIIGYYEGEDRNKGRLGGFIIDYKGVEVRCGGGLDDAQREHYWSIKDAMIGRLAKIKYTEITEDGSLRFPIFMSERDEK